MLKWAVLGGFAFFVLAGGWYVLAFLLDGSEGYGRAGGAIRPASAGARRARRRSEKEPARSDKLFAEKPLYNDGAYPCPR